MIVVVGIAGLACSTPRVVGVPEGAVRVSNQGSTLMVDGLAAGPMVDVLTDPFAEVLPDVVARLQARAGAPGWLHLEPDTPFVGVRKLVNSMRAAGLEPLVISSTGDERAYAWREAPRYALSGQCVKGPRVVQGAEPLITLSVQTGRDGGWLLASARFLPVVALEGAQGPVDGLPTACLSVPSCDQLFSRNDALRAACLDGSTGIATDRVGLGGANGCVAPIASPEDVASAWPDAVAAWVQRMELAERPLLMVMPEAQVQLRALLGAFEGFRRASLAPPAVGSSLLVEGNDGPPTCNAAVRDASSLSAAGARWLGAQAVATP